MVAKPKPVIIDQPIRGKYLIVPVEMGTTPDRYNWIIQDYYAVAYHVSVKQDVWSFTRREKEFTPCDCDDCLAEYGARPSYIENMEVE